MQRVLIHAFPAKKPEAVVLVDAGRREITTIIGEEIVKAKEKLADYDIIAAINARVGPTRRASGNNPSRVQRVHVEKDKTGWPLWLVNEGGHAIDKDEVQVA